MPAVRNADSATKAEAPFSEVQPIAHCPPNAIVRAPLDEGSIHTALKNKILNQAAHVIIGKRGADSGAQAEAAAQTTGNVVLATAFPRLELTRGAHPSFAGVKAQHDLPQGNHVIFTGIGGLNV